MLVAGPRVQVCRKAHVGRLVGHRHGFVIAGLKRIGCAGDLQYCGRIERPGPIHRGTHILPVDTASVHPANRGVSPILPVFIEVVPAPARKQTVVLRQVVVDPILVSAIVPQPRRRHCEVVVPGLHFRICWVVIRNRIQIRVEFREFRHDHPRLRDDVPRHCVTNVKRSVCAVRVAPYRQRIIELVLDRVDL